MKKKIMYTFALICLSLVISSHRNIADCDAQRCNKFCKSQSLQNSQAAQEEARVAIPAATAFLPGYSILLVN
jgi:hypothetical protein